ncbi:t-SNARE, partial [Blyttiomyces helicus]
PATGGLDDFFSTIQESQQSLARIENNLGAIEQLQRRAVTASASAETERIQRQLTDLEDQTTSLMQTVRRELKAAAAETARTRGADAGIRRAQEQGVAKKLMAAAQRFQGLQSRHSDQQRARMAREMRIARPDATAAEIESAINSGETTGFAQSMMSSRTADQRRALGDMQNRHNELLRIEQSVEQLFNLFQEMQALLDAQQQTIDTIDSHVENTFENVQEGSKELSSAIVSAKSSRKTARWICLCVLVLLIIV